MNKPAVEPHKRSALGDDLRDAARLAPESGIVEVMNYGRQRGGVTPLWAGEGDLPTPAFICEARPRGASSTKSAHVCANRFVSSSLPPSTMTISAPCERRSASCADNTRRFAASLRTGMMIDRDGMARNACGRYRKFWEDASQSGNALSFRCHEPSERK